MEVKLETERIILTNFKKEDWSLIKNLDSDPDVVRFISNGVPSDDKEVDRAMRIFLTYNQKYNNEFGFWKATHKTSNEFMGWFHFRPLKSDPENIEKIELGYRLLKKFWGKGYATEGSQALISNGRENKEIKEIWAHAMAKNKSSINVMTKCGLSFSHDDIYDAWPGEDKECVWYKLILNQ